MCTHRTRVECKIQEWNEEETSIFALIGFLQVSHETISCNGSIFPPSFFPLGFVYSPPFSFSLGFFHFSRFLSRRFIRFSLSSLFCHLVSRIYATTRLHGTWDLTGNKFRSVSLKPFANQRESSNPSLNG